MTGRRQLPDVEELTFAQHQGWACCWCGKSLWTEQGGVSVGRAVGANGFSIEVYACPDCAPARPSSLPC